MTAPFTVLVVEDNPITRRMLRMALQQEGWAVIEAADGRTALDECERSLPDLVLQDLVLPDMSGFDLVRRLRLLRGSEQLVIVALSGFLGRIEEAQAVRAGFDAFLAKPIEPEKLIDSIRRCLPLRRAPVLPPIGNGRRLLLCDDDPIQLKVTRIHLAQMGFTVVAAHGAAELMAAARQARPDLIVSDVLMPHVDGFRLCLDVRRDPALARVPVVLVATSALTEADLDLARRVGANALVHRSAHLEDLAQAVVRALAEEEPARAEEPSERLELRHAQAMVQLLERHRADSAGLDRRCRLQAAQITLLSGVAEALTRGVDTDTALRDVLAATLDAVGISKGALYLRDPQRPLVLRHAIGFSQLERGRLDDFFGRFATLEQLIERQLSVALPSDAVDEDATAAILEGADVHSMQVVVIGSEGRGAGAIVLGARPTDVPAEDAATFARAMAHQLAQSLDLERAFARVAASELRYRTLTESATDAIAVVSADGVIREVNRRASLDLGYPPEELIGRHVSELARMVDSTSPAGFDELLAREGGRATAIALRKANGDRVLMEFSTAFIVVNEERLLLAVGRDVTDQMRAQAQLMVSDRMVTIGTLAAGVAHEINNPLSAVIINLDLALHEVDRLVEQAPTGDRGEDADGAPSMADLRSELQDAREAAERVRHIVRDVKMFSRSEDLRRDAVDTHRVIESSLRMAWNEIRHRAQLVRDYGAVPAVLANESRLGQVILNLVINAAQAIPEGQADVNEIRVRTRLQEPSGNVVIEVSDTGSGMTPETMKQLFTPFFTTKRAGIGTGLGLTICQRIVSEMGGEISAETELGRGSTFRVVIPATTSDELEVPPPPVTAAGRRGRVLVVDDERMVGGTTRRLLASEHDVEALTSAHDALERIRGGERFDVILCDLMMPVMTGMDLHAALVTVAPEQAERMVFFSGGAFTERARAFLDDPSHAVLEKPFEIEALRSIVNRLVAG